MKTPCRESETPDDWFISRDGRQYPSDPLVSQEVIDERFRDSVGTPPAERDRIVDRLEAEARREALRRRRHAKEACHEKCYFRLECLGLAIESTTPIHGTWGGYYEEELDQIRREKSRQDRVRAARER